MFCLIFISLIYKVYPVYKANTTILRIAPITLTGEDPSPPPSPIGSNGTVFSDTFYSEMLKSSGSNWFKY